MMLSIGETSLPFVGARAALEKRNSCESLFCYGNHSDGRCDVGRSGSVCGIGGDTNDARACDVQKRQTGELQQARNDSKMAIKVKAGVNEVVLEPGKIVSMKLVIGVQVVAEETALNYPSRRWGR